MGIEIVNSGVDLSDTTRKKVRTRNWYCAKSDTKESHAQSLHSVLNLQVYRVKTDDKGNEKRELIAQQASVDVAVSEPKASVAPVTTRRRPVPPGPRRKARSSQGFSRISASVAAGRARVLNVRRGQPLSGYVRSVDVLGSIRDNANEDEETEAEQAIMLFGAYSLKFSGEEMTQDAATKTKQARPGSAGSQKSARSNKSDESAMSGESSVSFQSAASGMSKRSKRSKKSKAQQLTGARGDAFGVSTEAPPMVDVEATAAEFAAKLEAYATSLGENNAEEEVKEEPKQEATRPQSRGQTKTLQARVADADAASAKATQAFARTLRQVTAASARNDHRLALQLKAIEKEWHQFLPLKFDCLLPGAHASTGRLAEIPRALLPPRATTVKEDDVQETIDDFESDRHSLGGTSQALSMDGERQYKDALVEVKAMKYRVAERQRGKLAEAVRLHQWLRPVLQKLASDASKHGGLPRSVLKFLSALFRFLAAGAELTRPIVFTVLLYAFKGDDWKLKIVEHVIPLICEALRVPHDHVVAWFKENNIATSQSFLRHLKKKMGGRRGKGAGKQHFKNAMAKFKDGGGGGVSGVVSAASARGGRGSGGGFPSFGGSLNDNAAPLSPSSSSGGSLSPYRAPSVGRSMLGGLGTVEDNSEDESNSMRSGL